MLVLKLEWLGQYPYVCSGPLTSLSIIGLGTKIAPALGDRGMGGEEGRLIRCVCCPGQTKFDSGVLTLGRQAKKKEAQTS